MFTDLSTCAIINVYTTYTMNPIDTNRIAVALERIAQALEHLNIEHVHIDEIEHNHVEGDINTHAKKW